MVLPIIFGCAGTTLTADEKAFFAETKPFGFILFARNVETPDQIRALCAALRESVDRHDAPILIDQEGGRVARLKGAPWHAAPPARVFGDLWDRDPEAAREATTLNARLIGADLAALGITVDCAPVLDVPVTGAHDVIGDRAFHSDPEVIAALGRAQADGLLQEGVLPVMKHIPGHGRSKTDSHAELPVVDASRRALARDFAPFAALADLPLAMTAHILYPALDDERPATTSAVIVEHIIRDEIGFDGLLMSDDISSNMKALPGDYARRTKDCLAAGCDVVLHCDGDLAAMHDVAAAAPDLTGEAAVRWGKAAFETATPDPLQDRPAAEAELARLLASS